jgi:hypothetical protein
VGFDFRNQSVIGIAAADEEDFNAAGSGDLLGALPRGGGVKKVGGWAFNGLGGHWLEGFWYFAFPLTERQWAD